MQDFRVIELPERTALDASDYAMIDSANNGTNKYLLSRMTAETDAKIATAVSGVEAELNTAVEGIEENITALQGDVETVETTLETKADVNGTYPSMAVGSLLGAEVEDKVPYLFRPTGGGLSVGDREYDEIVGGTVGWNQLCNGASVTVANGRKYLSKIGSAWSIGASTGSAITGLTAGSDMVIDLTTLFGSSTIADYIYSLEQATAGAGVAWFRQYFGKDYYPYSAPTLKSVEGLTAHEMVGFNQWDEVWEVGYIDSSGNNTSSTVNIRSKNYIPVLPNVTYYLRTAYTTVVYCPIFFYDSEKNFISTNLQQVWNRTITTPSNASYMRFYMNSAYGTTYNHDICINLHWDGEKDGQYEPYEKHSYPLDDSLTLRGIPKLDASNNLYYDGDVYASDGTVTRRYGVVDLGALNWSYSNNVFYADNVVSDRHAYPCGALCAKYEFYSDFRTITGLSSFTEDKKFTFQNNLVGRLMVCDSSYSDAAVFKTAMSGVMLVYELATPTEETATPYTSPQIVDDFGTEEYVTDSIVPVGHNTKYPENLATKISNLPSLPTEAGTYRLKVTVTAGKASYEWVSA